MFYRLQDNKIVDSAEFKYADDCLETEKNIVRNIDGELVFEEETLTTEYIAKKKAFEEEQKLNELRAKRETECFTIINRGELWYDTLTNDQIAELNEWYRAWLNVTETKVIPKKLTWLK